MQKIFKAIRPELPAVFVLLLLALFVYRPLPSCGFVNFDDDLYVTDNLHVKTGISLPNMKWAFVTSHSFNWHPMTWLSHMLDVELYGMDAGRHHMTSLLFHIINTILLLLWLSKFTRRFWPSCFVAALFLLHPLHVESVAWISERKDVLSTFFGFLTMFCYTGYLSSPGKIRYVTMMLFFMLGLMSKPMLVTLPFLLLLLDYWPLGRIKFEGGQDNFKGNGKSRMIRALVWEKIPLFILSVIACLVTFKIQKITGAVANLTDYPVDLRFVNAIIAYCQYIIKTLWPFNLSVFYPYPTGYAGWEVAVAAFFLFSVTLMAIVYGRRLPWLFVGWFWYLGTLIPVIGLVQVGDQSMADRYTYIPLIGLFIILAWGGAKLASIRTGSQKFAVLIGCGFILFCLVRTNAQVTCWKDSISLFNHAIRVTSGNALAYNNLGMALAEKGRPEEAILNFQRAIQIDHKDALAYNNLGAALIGQGQLKEALEYFKKALILSPEYADAENNMGIVLKNSGNIPDAIKHLKKALIFEPSHAHAHYNLGALLIRENKISEAMEHLTASLKFDPQNAEVHNYLGTVLARYGRINQAVKHFQAAVWLNPENITMKKNLEKGMAELTYKTDNSARGNEKFTDNILYHKDNKKIRSLSTVKVKSELSD